MKNLLVPTFSLFYVMFLCACTSSQPQELIKIDEVTPWCIVDFDSLNRTPQQRITMLKQMGFTKYGFERGKGDLSQMKYEFQLAKENGIEITSVFLWLNAERDSIGKLSPKNQELLSSLAETHSRPTLWVSFSHNFFEGLDQRQSITLSTEMIEFVKLKADELGCKLALYNHHGWFGNPYNQVEILERLNQDSITMVYNFHHAHEYIDEFPVIAKKIKPYLSHVNLNGVKKPGSKILPIGAGDYEFDMIMQLLDVGFDGPWGILGHDKSQDVQEVLNQNIEGLKLLNSKLSQSREN